MEAVHWFTVLQEFALEVYGPVFAVVAAILVASAMFIAVLIVFSAFFSSNT